MVCEPAWHEFFENIACLGMYWDALAISNDRWAAALSILGFLTEWLVANPIYINLLNTCARLIHDCKLPVPLKMALRILLIFALGGWFFLLNYVLFIFPIPYTAAFFGALGLLHLWLRRVISSQRAYMPIRISEVTSLISKLRAWRTRARWRGASRGSDGHAPTKTD